SGAKLAGLRAGERGRDLVVTLVEPLTASDQLLVEGVSDRAGRPNLMASARVPVELTAWPGTGEGLVFAYRTDGAAPAVRDVDSGHERTFSVVPHGRSRYDAYGALRVAGGWFEVEDLPERLAAAFRESNAFTLEATVWPELERTEDPARIVSFAYDAKSQNLSLSQDGSDAVLRVRVTKDGGKDQAAVEFGHLLPDMPNHLLVTYRPGRLVAYQNGQRVLDTDGIQGDLSDWRDEVSLALGADPAGGGRNFAGRIEGVALSTRFFEPTEAAEHANAYLHEIGEREPVPRLRMQARLVASSVLPTPEQILPYREALVVNEYEVPEKRRERIGAERVRVAHWAVLDGRAQPVPNASAAGPVWLELEPWERHPRLESTYLSDTLDVDPEIPLYVDAGA
ncbi:MAG TPA: LamG-like jellyroll fold domain-containing protein, partial [Vicinamibacteria bacterium]|nr:LamG-like jellyroll fold domain-containing protein [Vicinamibacteria bacterium]